MSRDARRSARQAVSVAFVLGAACAPARDAGTTFGTVVAGMRFTCGLTGDGRAFCWGGNQHGELGSEAGAEHCRQTRYSGHGGPPSPVPCSSRPIPVAGDLRFRAISAGAAHVCALTHDGSAYCWGRNDFGQLGSGSADTSSQFRPAAVAGDLRFRAIDAGVWHTCAIALDGRAYCWGHNGAGRAGTPLDSACIRFGQRIPCNLAPKPVSTDLRFSSIDAGAATACGVADFSGYCWGSHLAIGSDTASDDGCREQYACSTRPVAIGGGIALRSISVGSLDACAVSTRGRVYCWGPDQDLNGSVRGSADTSYRTPQLVGGDLVADTVILGLLYTCALPRDGRPQCWGYGRDGILGDSSGRYHTPISPFRRPRFVSLTAGGAHICGIARNGETYCWGENTFGQLGSARVGPDSVTTPTKVVSIR
jgi:alpha-tubulin suppressor-like RCC1 family protein